VINGILWRLRTGAAWRDVPERYGDWNKIHRRFSRWSEAGIWKALANTLAEAMGDSTHRGIDSTTVRGHASATAAKGKLANGRLAARWAGSPVKFIVSVTPSADRSASTSPAAKRRTAKATTR
jgi:transposase